MPQALDAALGPSQDGLDRVDGIGALGDSRGLKSGSVGLAHRALHLRAGHLDTVRAIWESLQVSEKPEWAVAWAVVLVIPRL